MSETNFERKPEELKIDGTIDVSINGEALTMDIDNYPEVIKQIKQSLNPGTPVYIETIGIGHGLLARPYATGHVLLSDGRINEKGKFGMMNGQYGCASATLGKNYLQIHQNHKGAYYREGITLPNSWFSKSINEGTFSPAGPYTVTTRQASGTHKIVIGEQVNVSFDALTGIEFVQDAVHIDAPYRTLTHAIDRKGDFERSKKEAQAIEKLAGENDLLSFVIKMVKNATRQLDNDFCLNSKDDDQVVDHKFFDEIICARQVSSYSDGAVGFEIEGHYLMPDDFIVYESGGPSRYIGYVKANVASIGEGYFLPAEGMEHVAKLAFDPDFIKQFYPEA